MVTGRCGTNYIFIEYKGLWCHPGHSNMKVRGIIRKFKECSFLSAAIIMSA